MDQIQIGQWKIGFMIFKTTGVDIIYDNWRTRDGVV